MLKAKLECLKRETSGTDFDCNNSNCDECSLCYEQGNMGEQKEALDMAIKALEQEHPKGKWIKLDSYDRRDHFYACSECGRLINIICNAHLEDYPFCHCGADMRGAEDG